MTHRHLLAAALAAAILAPGLASANDTWFVRVGVHNVDPKSNSGTLAGVYKTTIDSDFKPTVAFGYHLNDNVAIELLAALPFKHEVSLDGVGAVDFTHLPPTLSLQYYFAPQSKVNPFVGAGINYTWTYDEKTKGPIAGTKVGIENSWGLAAQAGLLFQAGRNWDIVADAWPSTSASDRTLTPASDTNPRQMELPGGFFLICHQAPHFSAPCVAG
jgi:outer membrane protein